MIKTIALIECCNFVDYPTGGQLSFAKHMIESFGDELVLVGMTTEKGIVGKWSKLEINGIEYNFFPYIYLPKKSERPIIPLRLRNYLALRKYKNEIIKAGFKNVITQSFDTTLAIRDLKFENTCYRFAGTENPLSVSRYKIARLVAFLCDKYILSKLSNTDVILAAANSEEIDTLVRRSRGRLRKEKIKQFPTRVNTEVFHKKDKFVSRSELSIPFNEVVIVTTGRLTWFKGWKFMIDTFKLFQLNHSTAQLYFIGNGEDFDKIFSYLSSLGLGNAIHMVGFKSSKEIVNYLNAADLFIMGSYKEGWSTSLLEAIACGTPACVTNFSSSKEIIVEGINGYVAENRNEIQFEELMNKCLSINREYLPRRIDIDKYSVTSLKKDLLKLWPLV